MKKRTKRIICAVLIIALLIELVTCSIINDGKNDTDNSTQNTIEQSDDANKDVVDDTDNDELATENTEYDSSSSETKKYLKKSKSKSDSKDSDNDKKKDKDKKKEKKKEKYTITFIDDEYPDENEKVTKTKITLEKGEVLGDEQYPVRNNPSDGSGKVFLGYFFDKDSYDYIFLDYLAYDRDITVYARYGSYSALLNSIDYVFEEPVGTDFSITIQANEDNTHHGMLDIKNNCAFYMMDTVFAYVLYTRVDIIDNGGGSYTLRIKELEPGRNYGFFISGGYKAVSSSWNSGENTQELSSDYNFISFKIDKDEKDFKYRDDITWLKYSEPTEAGDDISDVVFTDVETKDVATNEDGKEEIKYVDNFFSENDKNIEVNDVVCVYKGVCPKDRKYADQDSSKYLDQTDVYFCVVTKIETEGAGKRIYTRHIEDDEFDRVLLIPKVIPFKLGDAPSGKSSTPVSGTLNVLEYDAEAWAEMGGSGTPSASVGDFVVLYQQLDENTTNDQLLYGLVTAVDNNIISYTETSYETVISELEACADSYVVPDLNEGLLTDAEQKEIEKEIKAQLNSGKSEYAKQVEEMVLASSEVAELMDDKNIDKSRVSIEASNFNVGVTQICKYLNGDGAKVSVRVGAIVIIKAKLKNEGTFSEARYLHYAVSANFTQEFKLNLSGNGEFDIGWHFIIPYLKNCWFSISVDIQTATDFTFDVRHYVTSDSAEKWGYTDNEAWEKFRKFITSDDFILYAADYYKSESEYELYKDSDKEEDQQRAEASKAKMDEIWNNSGLRFQFLYVKIGEPTSFDQLKELTPASYWLSSFSSMRKRFNEFALNTTIVELLGTPEDGLDDTNMKAFVNKYQELMKIQNTWMSLFSKKLVDDDVSDIPIVPGIVGAVVSPTFYVEMNVNLAVNANFHLEYGKCYTIKVDIANWDISTNSTDTLNQILELRFVAMGTLGLRAGVKVDIGVKLLKVFTIGFSVDTGPYIEMDGYCFFEYTKSLSSNNELKATTKKAKGALYIEFGIRLSFDFKVKVIIFGGKSWNIWGHRFKLLGIGDKYNVYKFNYPQLSPSEMELEDNIAIVCGETGYKLPARFRMMGYMDMTNGSLSAYAADASHYTYKFYDENPLEEVGGKVKYKTDLKESKVLTADRDGKISRIDGGKGAVEGFAVIQWVEPTLAFSNYVIKRAIDVLFSSEQTIEKHPVTVVIKDKDSGEEEEVWTQSILEGRKYTLPSKAEIMETIDPDDCKYVANDCNYKDAGASGVPSYATGRVTGKMKFTFYVKRKTYELKLHYKYNATDKDGNRITPSKEGVKTYTAKYGDKFNISDTELNGTKIKESDTEYLIFSCIKGVEKRGVSEEAEWNRDWTQAIDGAFARELTDGKHYLQAIYTDNTVIVTYRFEGISMDDVSKKVERGTKAPELRSIWKTTEDGVKAKLMEAAGVKAGDEKLLSYTISPNRDFVYNNTSYLVKVTVQSLMAPYVIGSDRGNVKLASKNKVNAGETLYYGYSTKANATNEEITWFKTAYIPNLKKKTDYYFYCRKLFDNKPDRLLSPASEKWSWDEQITPEKTSWRNGVRIESGSEDDGNEGTAQISAQILFFDSEKTEVITKSVEPGEVVYTGDFEYIRDPWMIKSIIIKSDIEWVGSINTYSYDTKCGKDWTSNRTESSSEIVELEANKSRTVHVDGPKRKIYDVGNFYPESVSSSGAMEDTISLSDSTHLSADGKYWIYKYNGEAMDQFSLTYDEQGNFSAYLPYNVFEHDDSPYLEVELAGAVMADSEPLEFISCSTSEMKISVSDMKDYLATAEGGSLVVKVKIIFPERSTFIGEDSDTQRTELSNVFERTITITE